MPVERAFQTRGNGIGDFFASDACFAGAVFQSTLKDLDDEIVEC